MNFGFPGTKSPVTELLHGCCEAALGRRLWVETRATTSPFLEQFLAEHLATHRGNWDFRYLAAALRLGMFLDVFNTWCL
jgi:hypothetical protein